LATLAAAARSAALLLPFFALTLVPVLVLVMLLLLFLARECSECF
jgi:hypothetical protein